MIVCPWKIDFKVSTSEQLRDFMNEAHDLSHCELHPSSLILKPVSVHIPSVMFLVLLNRRAPIFPKFLITVVDVTSSSESTNSSSVSDPPALKDKMIKKMALRKKVNAHLLQKTNISELSSLSASVSTNISEE